MSGGAVVDRIARAGVISVIRADSPGKAVRLAEAVRAGGIDVIEITFTVPRAPEVIAGLRAADPRREALVGAGTVLTADDTARALEAGADFVVSPALVPEVVEACGRAGVPVMPGCMTVTEILSAYRAGAEVVKLFPASLLGPGFVRAVLAPLPWVRLVPTGGVTLETVGAWLRAGCLAVGVGGELTGTGDPAEVTRRAEAFRAAVVAARGAAGEGRGDESGKGLEPGRPAESGPAARE